ncbi:MAG: response regulator transcription factor [Propionibacteriaceae bacterium]|nr:response regulator transcription factor [Propionibacteriaceae bacterium]
MSSHPGRAVLPSRDTRMTPAQSFPPFERRTGQERALEDWLNDPSRGELASVVRIAVRLGRIDVLRQLWQLLRSGTIRLTPVAAQELLRLPEGLRARCPRITLLVAEAAGLLNDRQPDLRRLVSYVVRDASLHGHRWFDDDDPTSTLWGGIALMPAQRNMPAEPAGASILIAWQTRNRIDRSVKQFRATSHNLDSNVVGLFHACSAQLALAKADLATVSSEARFAEHLQPWPSVQSLAAGARDVAACLSGGTVRQPELSPRPQDKAGYTLPWSSALYRAGRTLSRLALALRALHQLDRETIERALSQVSLAEAVGADCWTLHAYLTALHDRIWATDLERGLAAFDAAVASCELESTESSEPFGRILIAQARSLLLSGLGAIEPAVTALHDLPTAHAGVGRAVAAMHDGDLDGTIRHTEAALYDPACWFVDRACLMLIQAAARALLPGMPVAESRRTAATALGLGLHHGTLLGLALLPKPARDALLDAYSAARADDPSLTDPGDVVTRLTEVADLAGHRAPSIELTRRERILLPMLASAESVPEIAKELHVSVNTVRKQVVTLRGKLGARSRSELIRRARELGLLPGQGSGSAHS